MKDLTYGGNRGLGTTIAGWKSKETLQRRSVRPKISRCPCCNKPVLGIHKWRRNTAYVNSEQNYLTCCHDCIIIDDIEYNELWAEYYQGQGYYYPMDTRKRTPQERCYD